MKFVTLVDVGDPFAVILEQIRDHLGDIPPEKSTIFRSGRAYVTREGEPITVERMQEELAIYVSFNRVSKGGGFAPCYPPKDIVRSFLAKVDERIPELRGYWHGPLIRPNGDVITKEGYDPESKMWLSGWDGPEIGSTREEAEEALLILWNLVNDPGPLEDERNYAAWIAHGLTVAARPIILGPVPMFVYESSAPGSGKTTLATLAGKIGGACEGRTTYERKAELARNLSDHLLKAAVVIDNVEGRFDNQVLASAITDGQLLVRRMRENPVRMPMRCVISVTANGPEVARDWMRRSIPISVEPARLNKERDLLAEVDEVVVCALYTILSAWLKSGEASEASTLKTFQDWSRIVAGALKWLGLPDVVEYAEQKVQQLVDSKDDWSDVIDEIERNFGVDEFTAAEAYAALGGLNVFERFENARSLGQQLKAMSDSRDGVMRVIRPSKRSKKGWLYRIVTV